MTMQRISESSSEAGSRDVAEFVSILGRGGGKDAPPEDQQCNNGWPYIASRICYINID